MRKNVSICLSFSISMNGFFLLLLNLNSESVPLLLRRQSRRRDFFLEGPLILPSNYFCDSAQ